MTQQRIESFLPRNGLFCFLAQLIARILPSVPLIPKPPGTKTPLWEWRKDQHTRSLWRILFLHWNNWKINNCFFMWLGYADFPHGLIKVIDPETAMLQSLLLYQPHNIFRRDRKFFRTLQTIYADSTSVCWLLKQHGAVGVMALYCHHVAYETLSPQCGKLHIFSITGSCWWFS